MDRPLRVLDLFSGLDGWGDPFREAGHEVFSVDIDERFDADVYLDIGDVAAVLDGDALATRRHLRLAAV